MKLLPLERMRIIEIIRSANGRSRHYGFVTLADGHSLLQVQVRTPGVITYSLIDGADLLGDPLAADVTEEVEAEMASNFDWLVGLQAQVDAKGTERVYPSAKMVRALHLVERRRGPK
jgi:hypothetical protein